MNRKILALVLVIAFTWTMGGAGEAFAAYEDESGDLPGMDNDIGPILIIGGVVIAGLIIYKVVKKSGDDDQAQLDGENPSNALAGGGSTQATNFLGLVTGLTETNNLNYPLRTSFRLIPSSTRREAAWGLEWDSHSSGFDGQGIGLRFPI